MRLRFVPPTDELIADDGATALLLYPHLLVRLGTLGLAITELTAEPVTLEDLAARLVAEFGAPPGEPLAQTRAAVDELLAQGVLEWVDAP